jgi:hypothetical protein
MAQHEHQDVACLCQNFQTAVDQPAPAASPPADYWAAEQIPSYDCIDPDYPFEAYV